MSHRMAGGQRTFEEHQAYYDEQTESNAEFWHRFGSRPDVTGKRVLDLGCGHGAMSVELARAGAEVLGIDLDRDRIAFAQAHVASRHPALQDRLRFEAMDLSDLPAAETFDLALSKDTFEHVEDMPAMAKAIFRVLKPGGQLWAGFSPLYWSPFGDHARTGFRIPWAHAILPRRFVLWRASRSQGHHVGSLDDIGLNGMTPEEFRHAMATAGFVPRSIAYNRGGKPLMRTLSRLRRRRRLEKWATVGIYAVYERPGL